MHKWNIVKEYGKIKFGNLIKNDDVYLKKSFLGYDRSTLTVMVQADEKYRAKLSDMNKVYIKNKKGRENSRPFCTLSCLQGIVCYTIFCFRMVKK